MIIVQRQPEHPPTRRPQPSCGFLALSKERAAELLAVYRQYWADPDRDSPPRWYVEKQILSLTDIITWPEEWVPQ
jgi:hypothetical protein